MLNLEVRMLYKSGEDIEKMIRVSTDKNRDNNLLGKYYTERKKALQWPNTSIRQLDDNEIILYKIPYTSKYDYYPVEIAQYALGNYETFLDTRTDHYKDSFLKQAEWLTNNITIKPGGFAVWEHSFTLPYYDFNKIPWVHGMAQGLAISALLRAYQLTDDTVYFETAEKAYGAFEKDIKEGGVRYTDKNGNIWLEEYSVMPPPHILNGFVFALFGVYDFYRVTKEERVLGLWREGIKTLEKNIYLYDNGYWSLYNLLHEYPATKSYHGLHIEQLNVLHELTKKRIFLELATRWDIYLNKPLNRGRAIIKRGVIHIKRYGLKGCIDTYFLRRKWTRK